MLGSHQIIDLDTRIDALILITDDIANDAYRRAMKSLVLGTVQIKPEDLTWFEFIQRPKPTTSNKTDKQDYNNVGRALSRHNCHFGMTRDDLLAPPKKQFLSKKITDPKAALLNKPERLERVSKSFKAMLTEEKQTLYHFLQIPAERVIGELSRRNRYDTLPAFLEQYGLKLEMTKEEIGQYRQGGTRYHHGLSPSKKNLRQFRS